MSSLEPGFVVILRYWTSLPQKLFHTISSGNFEQLLLRHFSDSTVESSLNSNKDGLMKMMTRFGKAVNCLESESG
jgi:hypothetical protein